MITPKNIYKYYDNKFQRTFVLQDINLTLEEGNFVTINLIFLHLRRSHKELFYFDNKSSAECDFVVMKNGKAKQLIQVCYELTSDNLDREIKGLTEAMRFFSLKKGMIVTLKDSDKIKKDGYTIEVVPAHEVLANSL